MTSLLTAIGQHIILAYGGFLISAVLGIGSGVIALKSRWIKVSLIMSTSLLQAIPAFTIVALIVPFLGIGFLPALVVIVVATLLPVVRNTIIGLSSPDPILIEVADSIGMTWNNILIRVRFPLGIRPIFSGLRLSSIVANAVAVITVFIGSGGLGSIVLEGLVRFHTPGILAGVIPAIGIALFADVMLRYAENRLAPL
ncbi:MAG: ABC transporter permease [Methanospirillaceae archaeon]|nr:ABC transporter permease [Methanospirillaceae archaeon]